jgi:Protein of unknown function (DUF3016)
MRVNLYCLLVSLSACIVTSPTGAGVTVSFVEPDTYTDTGQFGREADSALREIEAHLKYLGARYLPPGQILKIEVLDIDLAGRRPFSIRLNPGTRILEGKADWPSIKLHYVLESGSRVLDDRQENVSDMGYLRHPKGKYSTQSFPYEKQMLEEWFKQRFAEDKPVRN